MTFGQIEKNLLVLLDPAGESRKIDWQFIAGRKDRPFSMASESKAGSSVRTVHCFRRRDLLGYLVFRLKAIGNGRKGDWRHVYYVNDGILSALFNAEKTSAYRAFVAAHLPRPRGLRRKFLSLLPLSLRAEKRYIALSTGTGTGNRPGHTAQKDLEGIDFMFFSNVRGKLLLARSKTLMSGKGMVYKTTTNKAYVATMEREFATMSAIAGLQGNHGSLPFAGQQILAADRIFFPEEYVPGKNFREVLHVISASNDVNGVCRSIDRLDEWFLTYTSQFETKRRSLSSCYGHVFGAFNRLYGLNHKAQGLAARAQETILAATLDCGEVHTIIAHNDLWPGNLMVQGERFVAIDWERARPDRAPFFEYYWMIISAVLEYHVCRIGIIDYSRAFRIFLEDNDAVSRHGSEKLFTFLARYGLCKEMHQGFLLLFLMEWAVQGYLATGRQTAMDRLAFEELCNYEQMFGQQPRWRGRPGYPLAGVL